jgi:anti-anti-sigma regulatory factor
MRFHGVLDISRYPEFREAFQDSPRDAGVLVDLREVTAVDSIFLSELVLFRRRHQFGVAVLVQADGDLAKLFRIARLGDKLEIYDALGEAVAALGNA